MFFTILIRILLNGCPALRGSGYRRNKENKMQSQDETRKGHTPIKVWVTPTEKKAITDNAKLHGLSTSAFLRNVGLGIQVTGKLDQALVMELAKLNADQGRLGGLLKLWLSDDRKLAQFNQAQIIDTIEGVLEKIYQMQLKLLDKVEKL
jgi:hypothetical protein